MTCYDETRDKNPDGPIEAFRGPRVQRDGNNVREIAEDPECFLGHSRPRRYVGRDDDWGK
jgi:hypothetical protein